jgi:flavin reductase (DIM6/NTAB) family NADH-FMN oxidoreductase RutF
MHLTREPAIFYLGTPVVLISTANEDGSTNIAPMSSAWWLGWSCMLGLDASSKTTENLRRTGECVLNLPSCDGVEFVDRLAMLTGSSPVPVHKKRLGYLHARDKFAAAGLTPQPSEVVAPLRARECPVQLEAKLVAIRPFAAQDTRMAIPACAIEVRIVRAHFAEGILHDVTGHKVDPDKWRPLIMSFRHCYGLGERAHASRLGRGSEEAYAPWRSRGLRRAVGMVYRRWADRRYAVTEVDAEPDATPPQCSSAAADPR